MNVEGVLLSLQQGSREGFPGKTLSETEKPASQAAADAVHLLLCIPPVERLHVSARPVDEKGGRARRLLDTLTDDARIVGRDLSSDARAPHYGVGREPDDAAKPPAPRRPEGQPFEVRIDREIEGDFLRHVTEEGALPSRKRTDRRLWLDFRLQVPRLPQVAAADDQVAELPADFLRATPDIDGDRAIEEDADRPQPVSDQRAPVDAELPADIDSCMGKVCLTDLLACLPYCLSEASGKRRRPECDAWVRVAIEEDHALRRQVDGPAQRSLERGDPRRRDAHVVERDDNKRPPVSCCVEHPRVESVVSAETIEISGVSDMHSRKANTWPRSSYHDHPPWSAYGKIRWRRCGRLRALHLGRSL